MIELRYDTRDLEELVDTLQVVPDGLEKATARAINRTLVSTRAYMVKIVCRDYAVKAGDVRRELAIKKANWSTLTGKISGSGSPGIPLVNFVRMRRVPSTRRIKSYVLTRAGYYTRGFDPKIGVPVLVRRDRGKVPAKGVFVARMSSGHVGAFKRVSSMQGNWWQARKKGPDRIREVYGPSPIKILSSDRYDEDIGDFADESMEKNLRSEAAFVLGQMGLR